jgi:hypothetical protein
MRVHLAEILGELHHGLIHHGPDRAKGMIFGNKGFRGCLDEHRIVPAVVSAHNVSPAISMGYTRNNGMFAFQDAV